MELIAEEQKPLTQVISETKDKLELLKLTDQQANDVQAKGEFSRASMIALQRQIVEMEKVLEGLNQSTMALQKIEAIGEKLQSVISSIKGMGKILFCGMVTECRKKGFNLNDIGYQTKCDLRHISVEIEACL